MTRYRTRIAKEARKARVEGYCTTALLIFTASCLTVLFVNGIH